MTVKELNTLVENAYVIGLSYENRLANAYRKAFLRASLAAADKFSQTAISAAGFVPPPSATLTSGMTEGEKEDVNRIRDEAARAVTVALAAIGIGAVSVAFMKAIADRGQLNFEQELDKVVRDTIRKGLEEGWTVEETTLVLSKQFSDASPSTVQMLAQTELTTLVNQRSLEAAQKTFQDREAPVYKTWETMKDNRVRAAHASSQGQTVPINSPFNVGGFQMMYPGDPSAPLKLVARCRCRMTYSETLVASTEGSSLMPMNDDTNSVSSTSSSVLDPTALGFYEIRGSDGTVVGWSSTPWPMTASSVTVTINDDEPNSEVEAEPMADGPAWKALLAVEGVPTEDGRMLADGSLTWRELPLSLTAMDTSNHGEPGQARVAGRIDRIWRDGNEVWGSGVFNSDEFGTHIYELVSNQSLRGNSIEPAVLAYETWDRETMQPLEGEALLEAMMEERPLLTVFTDAIIMASTVVATPALGDATIMLASGTLRTAFYTPFKEETLTASAAGMAPLHPPLAWFERPPLDGPTPMTVTDEGRIYGHAALWDSCHIGEPSGPGICVPPPRSGMNYEIFHHGVVTTEEGVDVPCGQITMSTFHAGRDLGWKAALEHYEHSGCCVADVVAGEDEYGIWVSGGLRPDLPAARVREMKAGALSGDWREVIGRGLEFLAALVVNIPGFPIPRPEARVVASAAGEEQVLALVAAGIALDYEKPIQLSRSEILQISLLTRDEETFRDYSAAERKRMAKNGQALPDGSFPIANCSDAANAIRSVGRASNPDAAKAHIRKRVRALGCSGSIYDNWK